MKEHSKAHWEGVYTRKGEHAVSWFQAVCTVGK